MDIDLLARMVKEVMMDRDAVTLPGVGTFLAELVPATFADKGYTIHPPYRRLYFMPKQGNDTFLADLYASSNQISQDDATQILVSFLAEMKEQLMVKKTIVFPGLGKLRATRENHFFFVADEDLDIYPAGFGLEPLSLKTHVETPEEVAAAVSSLASELLGPEVETIPEPEPTPEPIPAPDPDPEPEPTPDPEPDTVTEPVPEAAREPEPVIPGATEESPAAEELPITEESPATPRKRPLKGLWITLIVVAALVLLAAIAIAVAGRVAPEWLDSYLYSPEELEVLHP